MCKGSRVILEVGDAYMGCGKAGGGHIGTAQWSGGLDRYEKSDFPQWEIGFMAHTEWCAVHV